MPPDSSRLLTVKQIYAILIIVMKKDIHPTYYSDATIKCACGASYLVGSTEKELSIEICSACHPFYTGKQKLVDTAGRVDKFRARVKAAEKAKSSKPKLEEALVKVEAKKTKK